MFSFSFVFFFRKVSVTILWILLQLLFIFFRNIFFLYVAKAISISQISLQFPCYFSLFFNYTNILLKMMFDSEYIVIKKYIIKEIVIWINLIFINFFIHPFHVNRQFFFFFFKFFLLFFFFQYIPLFFSSIGINARYLLPSQSLLYPFILLKSIYQSFAP